MKKCEWCQQEKPLSAFWRAVHNADKRQDICKQCHIERGTGSPERRGLVRTGPPRTRRSPYENFGMTLRDIEQALPNAGAVREVIAAARVRFAL